jgi:plasmid maintenance system killer protein
VKIFFVDETLARFCNDDAARERRFGPAVAYVLRRRLAQIDAAEHLAELRQIPAIRLRTFSNDELTVALGTAADLQMRPRDDPPPRLDDGSLHERAVHTLLITDVLLAHAT